MLYQEIQIQITFSYITSNYFNFSWVFKDFSNKPGYNFDDASKNGYPSLLKIRVFLNKDYNVIITVDDVTNKIASRDSNYIVHVFMWPSLVTLALLWEKLPPSFTKIWTEKALFLKGGLGLSSIIWDWHEVQTWNFTPVW